MRPNIRIAVHSDFHIDAASHGSEIKLTVPACDVLVVAGDICAPCYNLLDQGYHGALRWLRSQVGSDLPVIFVAGNNEYSHFGYNHVIDSLAREAQEQDIHFLHNSSVDLFGVKFLGSPLFSSFNLPGHCPTALARYIDSKIVRFDMSRLHRDRCVCGSSPICAANNWICGTRDDHGNTLDHRWFLDQHRLARDFLYKELSGECDFPRVVVSHWAPSFRSIEPSEFPLAEKHAYWASNNDDLVAKANIWIHGHVHKSSFYRIGDDPDRGLVLSNCMGHPSPSFGNSSYCPQGLLSMSWDMSVSKFNTQWSGAGFEFYTQESNLVASGI